MKRAYEYRVKDREGNVLPGPVGKRGRSLRLGLAATIALAKDTLASGTRGTMLEVERQMLADSGKGTGWLLWRRYSIDESGHIMGWGATEMAPSGGLIRPPPVRLPTDTLRRMPARAMSHPSPASPAFQALAKRLGVGVDHAPTLGQQIRVARMAQGWSQVDLAEAAGVAQPRVDEAEGGANVTAVRLHQLATALGVALVVLPEAASPEPRPKKK